MTRRSSRGSRGEKKMKCGWMKSKIKSFQKNGIIFIIIAKEQTIYDASSPSFDGVAEGRRSTAGCDFVSRGEVGFDGGEVAMLS
jgi:hypothetical protein